MKYVLIILLSLITSNLFAAEKCIFDALGNCKKNEQPNESVKKIVRENGTKKYYVSPYTYAETNQKKEYQKIAPRKSVGKKNWYEVDWNQGVKLCPQKDQRGRVKDGIWKVRGSFHVDSMNCAFIEGSPYTRSILALFAQDTNDLAQADSSWILVNQTIVELTGKKYRVWKSEVWDRHRRSASKFIEVSLNQDLIVDKTELRVKDVLWLKNGRSRIRFKATNIYYPDQDPLNILDYPAPSDMDMLEYSYWRSQEDGLVDVYNTVPVESVDTSKILYARSRSDFFVKVFDSTANGYRLPFEYEWSVLQNGGKSTVFFWGDDADEKELSKYMDIKRGVGQELWGVYPVKQFKPNPFGLYDVYGNAEEVYMYAGSHGIAWGYTCEGYDTMNMDIGPSCDFINKYRSRVRGTKDTWVPVGQSGYRLVRKLE